MMSIMGICYARDNVDWKFAANQIKNYIHADSNASAGEKWNESFQWQSICDFY